MTQAIDLTAQLGLNTKDPMAEKFAARIGAKETDDIERRKTHMSPPGALGLSELLEKKRWEHFIPDGAFRVQAAFTRILVWQINDINQDWSETGLVMPESAMYREEVESPRCVLISAGLGAFDCLRSNGIEIGHTVRFLHLQPYAIRCDVIQGKCYYVRVMDVGDLIGSEELAERLRSKELRVVRSTQVDGYGNSVDRYVLEDEPGNTYTPVMPETKGDY